MNVELDNRSVELTAQDWFTIEVKISGAAEIDDSSMANARKWLTPVRAVVTFWPDHVGDVMVYGRSRRGAIVLVQQDLPELEDFAVEAAQDALRARKWMVA